MTEILTVPIKQGADKDLLKPLSKWIASTFGGAHSQVDLSFSVSELNKMRQCVTKLTDHGEDSLQATANYCDQIAALERKIPLSDLQNPFFEFPISFEWQDAFDRRFGKHMSLTAPSIAYEKVCVLFNVGALNSQVAANQNLSSSECLRNALKHLQIAAGIFSYLKENASGAIQQNLTPDMKSETLAALADIMLAQAQEMVVLKAINDMMKDALIAKLCAQCDEYFSSALTSMQKEAVKKLLPSDWLPIVAEKQAFYSGLAQYHQSRLCCEKKAVAEEVARLEFAKTLLTAGIERGTGSLSNSKEWLERTEQALIKARKDNDFIYHERIPEKQSLAPIEKAPVAKPALLTGQLGNPDAPRLFDSLPTP